MAKWQEKTNSTSASTSALIPWRTTIEHNADGSIFSIQTHYADVRTFSDGLVHSGTQNSTLIIVTSLPDTEKVHVDHIDNSIDKLVGSRLPA